MRAIENSMMSAIKREEILDVIVTPIYRGNTEISMGVTMYIKGDNGSMLNLTILNKTDKIKYSSASAGRKAQREYKKAIEKNFSK